jgi:hypothetical protein
LRQMQLINCLGYTSFFYNGLDEPQMSDLHRS